MKNRKTSRAIAAYKQKYGFHELHLEFAQFILSALCIRKSPVISVYEYKSSLLNHSMVPLHCNVIHQILGQISQYNSDTFK